MFCYHFAHYNKNNPKTFAICWARKVLFIRSYARLQNTFNTVGFGVLFCKKKMILKIYVLLLFILILIFKTFCGDEGFFCSGLTSRVSHLGIMIQVTTYFCDFRIFI